MTVLRMHFLTQYLKTRHETIKFTEENKGKVFLGISVGNYFFKYDAKTTSNKDKINKRKYIKQTNKQIKSSAQGKNNQQNKKLTYEMDKILENHIFDKVLLSKLHKYFIHLN